MVNVLGRPHRSVELPHSARIFPSTDFWAAALDTRTHPRAVSILRIQYKIVLHVQRFAGKAHLFTFAEPDANRFVACASRFEQLPIRSEIL